MYLQELRGEVSQGDILDDLPIVYATQGGGHFASTAMRSLLVTYDCEYDKPSTKLVMAAGIFSRRCPCGPARECPQEQGFQHLLLGSKRRF